MDSHLGIFATGDLFVVAAGWRRSVVVVVVAVGLDGAVLGTGIGTHCHSASRLGIPLGYGNTV